MEIHTSNCPKCGSVFRQNLRNLCSTCIQEENIFLDRCSNYLWKHPSTHTRQLSDVTGTPIELLTDWVRAGKFPPHTVSLIILVSPAVPLFMQETLSFLSGYIPFGRAGYSNPCAPPCNNSIILSCRARQRLLSLAAYAHHFCKMDK